VEDNTLDETVSVEGVVGDPEVGQKGGSGKLAEKREFKFESYVLGTTQEVRVAECKPDWDGKDNGPQECVRR